MGFGLNVGLLVMVGKFVELCTGEVVAGWHKFTNCTLSYEIPMSLQYWNPQSNPDISQPLYPVQLAAVLTNMENTKCRDVNKHEKNL